MPLVRTLGACYDHTTAADTAETNGAETMYATIPAREGLNFPTATAADWQQARRRMIGFLVRHDLDRERAEEIAQQWTVDQLDRDYTGACPASPMIAAGWAIARAKRYGIGTLTRSGERARYRRRAGLEEQQPTHVFEGAQDRAPGWTDPARMAAEGEALAARMPRMVARARKDGVTPATLAMRACGWGWPAEGGNVPSITDCGPGYTPPDRGCPGLHSTDPNPATRAAAYDEAAADAERVGLALTRSR